MPMSQFSEGLQKALSFLPGTYGTSLVRNHAMRGVFAQMESMGYPSEAINALRDAVDCNLYFFGSSVELGTMYAVLAGAVAVLIAAYVLINALKKSN